MKTVYLLFAVWFTPDGNTEEVIFHDYYDTYEACTAVAGTFKGDGAVGVCVPQKEREV